MIWRDLNTPDAFRRDWYGELTNQCGHTLLGALAAVLLCVVWRVAHGEMPYIGAVLFVVLVPYLAVEITVQGWKSGDSWFDSLMVALGAAVVLPFREVGVDGHLTILALDHRSFLSLFALWAVLLGARVARRYVANERQS